MIGSPLGPGGKEAVFVLKKVMAEKRRTRTKPVNGQFILKLEQCAHRNEPGLDVSLLRCENGKSLQTSIVRRTVLVSDT